VALAFFAPTATVMFGALLGRVPNPFALMDLFHVIYILAIAWTLVCGILGALGGFALLGSSKGGRGLLIVASLLALSDLPLGIALGAYTLMVLLPGRAVESLQTK
jgi:hypothetical protein